MSIKTFIAALTLVAATGMAHGWSETLVERGRIVLTAPDGKPRAAAEVRSMIIAGGRKQGWSVDADVPGKLTLLYSKDGGKHEVVVEALYDDQGYELKYVSSNNMNYSKSTAGKAEIHSAYNKWTGSLIGAIAVASPTNIPDSVARGSILLQMPATMDDDTASSKIGTECRVGHSVAGHVSKAMSTSFPRQRTVERVDSVPEGERGLKLSIVSTSGRGGGSFTGAKSITLRADLVDSKGVVATRTFVRRAGVTGPLLTWRTTCDLYERAALVIGKDVARWVADPNVVISDDAEEASASGPAAATAPEAAASPSAQ